MSDTTILLLVVLAVCAVGMAVFIALWLFGRDALAAANREVEARSQAATAAQSALAQLDARYKRASEALASLRQSSETERARSGELIAQWTARYQRLAHWEGVEDFKQRERELRETVVVLERAVEALRNTVEGYGSRYVVPPRSLLDQLAAEAAHSPPGQKLKEARELSRRLVRQGKAAQSDDLSEERARVSMNFTIDAFNGKVDAILAAAKGDNIGTLRQKLDDAFFLINEHGAAFHNVRITEAYRDARMAELRWAVKVQLVRQEEREQQRLVKERMREEAKAQREFDRAQREALAREEAIERERAMIESARAAAEREQRALFEERLREELARSAESERAKVEAEFRARMDTQQAEARAEYEARLADADARLAEALAARERAKSMAQQTKRGTVYVISNVGAFGDSIFKIGQTRRLDPMERIWELGDASVPFDFDVHALITTDDAPRLEGALHEHFVLAQVNKMNWRKEFFRVELGEIRRVVEDMGLEAQWTMTANAQQFRETQALELQFERDPALRDRWIQEQQGLDFAEPEQVVTQGLVDDE
jgi:hypothetical protein